MHKDFQKFNPFRSPSWRFERVRELLTAEDQPQQASAQRDDRYIRDYRRFMLRWVQYASDSERLRLFPKNPGLFYAHTLHFHPDTEWRAITQARILCRLSDEEVAAASNTLPSTIDWYEALFFNVRDRFDSRDWIVKQILGTAAARASGRDGSLTAAQRDLTYKLFAYYGGPLILDIMLAGVSTLPFPTKHQEVASWCDNTLKMLLRRRAMQMAQVFEVNRYQVMELFSLNCSIMQADANLDKGGPQTSFEKNMKSLLQMSPWETAQQVMAALPAPRRRYAKSAVEPRANEQFALVVGRVPDTLIAAEQNIDMSKVITVESQT